jgi:anti-anti-sigma factor
MDVPVQFSTTSVVYDEKLVVELAGELDMATAPELTETLSRLVEEGPNEIILDLSNLAFIDSAGIAVLITTQNQLMAQGRKLMLRSLKPNPLEVFKITGLLEFLNVETT